MPSIIPSYIYTIFASVIIGTIVIGTCGLVMSDVKSEAQEQQISNIARYVAVKSIDTISTSQKNNLTTTVFLDLPTLIGGQRYWIQISNDSSSALVKVGFGDRVSTGGQSEIIPAAIHASGVYVSGSANSILSCSWENSALLLSISGGK